MELRTLGYVEEIDFQPSSIEIIPKKKISYVKRLKTKSNVVSKTLLYSLSYTPDFMWRWTEKAKGIFYEDIDSVLDNKDVPFLANRLGGSSLSIVDTKAAYDRNHSNRAFSVTQKALYEMQGVYVQMIVPDKMFKKTFVPGRYLWTDKKTQLRKINFKFKTISEFEQACYKTPTLL